MFNITSFCLLIKCVVKLDGMSCNYCHSCQDIFSIDTFDARQCLIEPSQYQRAIDFCTLLKKALCYVMFMCYSCQKVKMFKKTYTIVAYETRSQEYHL